MGCGEFLVKYILFFANLVFALAGLVLLGIGVAVQLKISAVTTLIDGWYEFGPIATMVVGSIVFLIAFFGCCGAIKESNCMLVTYSIFMIVLMILKVALATVIFVNEDALTNQVTSEFNRVFVNNQTDFHHIETALHCCGPEGPTSYGVNILNLPPSCCEAATACTLLNSYPGCNKLAADFIGTFATAIGAVCIVVAALELHCCGPEGPTSYGVNILNLPPSCCEAATACTLLNSYPGCNKLAADFIGTFATAIGAVCIVVAALELHCCGPEGPTSYGVNILNLPPSCCEAATACTLLNSYPGCNKLAADFIGTFATAIGAVCIVVAALELVAVVFGLCLANHVRNRDRRTHY